MFFTRFRMNPNMRGSVRLAASPQRMHATILSAFPPDRIELPSGRVLWRLDTPTRHEWTLYIVSPARPSMEQLQSECGWSQEPSWQTADYGRFLDTLTKGQRWRFRLTANPVRSVAQGRGQRGRIQPHVTAEQQLAWLVERSANHGFRIDGDLEGPTVVTRRERGSFQRGKGAGRVRATLSRAQFDGLLDISDPELLRTTLTQGLGRAKAYGCGLMTLARLP
ncbi:MAG TPA: type I-E CRISPR-associated protein Cas6/Cse3/CasE [Intrasporangiaceae bacterium]|nr:type I-E CRISPR-associated protein Cas6/Cse3/CasE [Intrasporangiaceae bacterium]